MKITDYKIVKGDSTDTLRSAVLKQIEFGYIPQGGIFMDSKLIMCFQAMIKIEKEAMSPVEQIIK
jgi:hypothetical protein